MVPTKDLFEFPEFDDEMDDWQIKGLRRENRRNNQPSKKVQKQERAQAKAQTELAEAMQNEHAFQFSYSASRYEEGWLLESLGGFYDQHWIRDVLRMIKGGKEASVYQCQADETVGKPFLAAKVYRPRQFRNLKNDFIYREGRDHLDANGHIIHDSRTLHAIARKTGFGEMVKHTSWIEHEVQTMTVLYEAGADLPRPYASGKNAILMSYIGGREVAAPALNEISLSRDEARRLFERVLFNIELMLAENRIHADLSAYNILYWEGEISIIDFPQAIQTGQNRSAWQIFYRDVLRVCQYFMKFGVQMDPDNLARELWRKYKLQLVPEIDPKYLDAESPEDRSLWDQSNAAQLGL